MPLVSIIGLLLTTTLLGCVVLFNVNRALDIDPILLTLDDLRTMGVQTDKRIGVPIEQSKKITCYRCIRAAWSSTDCSILVICRLVRCKKSGGGQADMVICRPGELSPRTQSRRCHWGCDMAPYSQESKGMGTRSD